MRWVLLHHLLCYINASKSESTVTTCKHIGLNSKKNHKLPYGKHARTCCSVKCPYGFSLPSPLLLQLQTGQSRSRIGRGLQQCACEQKWVHLLPDTLLWPSLWASWMCECKTVRQSCWPPQWRTLVLFLKMNSVLMVSQWSYTWVTSPSLWRWVVNTVWIWGQLSLNLLHFTLLCTDLLR